MRPPGASPAHARGPPRNRVTGGEGPGDGGGPLPHHRKPPDGVRRALLALVGAGAALAVVGGSSVLGRATHWQPQAWALTEENLVFLEAWRTIDRAYIDKSFNGQSWFRYREDALRSAPMATREQTYEAIKKMLATLGDPFTRFLEPDQLRTLRSGTAGAVTGVGLEVGFDGPAGDLVVVAPVTGGPADRAGVAPGDVISAIDGVPTRGLTLYDAAQRLQGPIQSSVALSIERPDGKLGAWSSLAFQMTREKIDLNPVTWQSCQSASPAARVGYIRLSTFNQTSPAKVRKAIETLRADGATSFVLDVRNNGGGLFPSGVEIAKMFVDRGVIVYIADNKGVRDIYETEGEGALATEEPLAVLVNKGTASASEILAGALKDNKRATILGQNTFGKGKIQSVFELSDGSGLAVTIARYQTPSHIDIDKVGIVPDHGLPDGIPMDPEGFCRCMSSPDSPCSIAPSLLFSKT